MFRKQDIFHLVLQHNLQKKTENFFCILMINLIYLLIFLVISQTVFLLESNCDVLSTIVEHEVQLSSQDSLKFLVKESDLIVVIDKIKKNVGLFTGVNAHVVVVISGRETNEDIRIMAKTKFPDKGSYLTFVNFQEGKSLIFLSKEGNVYRPTTGSSVLNVWESRVYPVWDYKDGYGTGLGQVIEDIKNMKALLEKTEP